jgi:hypothetical protein
MRKRPARALGARASRLPSRCCSRGCLGHASRWVRDEPTLPKLLSRSQQQRPTGRSRSPRRGDYAYGTRTSGTSRRGPPCRRGGCGGPSPSSREEEVGRTCCRAGAPDGIPYVSRVLVSACPTGETCTWGTRSGARQRRRRRASVVATRAHTGNALRATGPSPALSP